MTYTYSFTPEIVRKLQSLEWPRAEVTLTVLPPAIAEGLRLRARVRSTHFSTRIEGNRLTLMEAEQAVLEGKDFPGRERDTWKFNTISKRWRRSKPGWRRTARSPRNASASCTPWSIPENPTAQHPIATDRM
jgi:hypothetical protein